MNYTVIIKDSPLSFSLIGISAQLIAGWLSMAKQKYQLPYLNGIHIDPQQVEEDLVATLSSAIHSLVNEKSLEKKAIPGWSFGYLCGYAQGELNVIWSDRYLIVPSQKFEDLLKLKAICQALKIDQIWQPIAKVYEYVLKNKHQWGGSEEQFLQPISLVKNKNHQPVETKKCRDEFMGYVNHIFFEKYKSLLNSHDAKCCPDLTNYLDKQEVIKLVGVEHFS
jgi:hypothetical protein